jgi:endonuclease IV
MAVVGGNKKEQLLVGGHLTLLEESNGHHALSKEINESTVFQCYLHSNQAHYTSARVNTWKNILKEMNSLPFKSNTPRLVHASYPTVPWSEKEGTLEKSIEDIRYCSRIANMLNIQFLNMHFSKELHLAPNFRKIVAQLFDALEPPCTLLFENVGNVPSTTMRLAFEKDNLVSPILKLRETVKVMSEVAKEWEKTNGRLPNWGICIDTAHCFVTGQVLTTSENVKKFTDVADELPVKAIHLNGSKYGLYSGKDVHAETMSLSDQIWGKDASGLKSLLEWARNKRIPLILERSSLESYSYNAEITALRALIGEK